MYQLLSQTTPENTSKKYSQYSIDPKTRYQRVNLSAIHTRQVSMLIFCLFNWDWGQSLSSYQNIIQRDGLV